MLTRKAFDSLILVFLLAVGASGQDTTNTDSARFKPAEITIGESATLKILGFGDLTSTIQKENDGNTFGIGQAEVNLESDLTNNVSMALAIAYDESAFGIGAFTIDWIAWQQSEETSSSIVGISNLTIGGGQFDVPFGIDWHVYPSIDRKLVSTPLIVENTHDGWNDYGGYASIEASWGSATVFGANGFIYEGESPTGMVFETLNQVAVGGRLGITPVEKLEVGSSFASIHSQDEVYHMQLVGADLQFAIDDLVLKGEYITHRFSSDENENFTNDGYYFQGLYNIGKWYAVGRYGEFRPYQKSTDITRLSGGIGRTINENVELRFEYQSNQDSEDFGIFQVAVGF